MIPGLPLRTVKLYADLVAPDGTVCVAYLLAFELAGLRRATGGVELYRPGRPPSVVRAVRAREPAEARGRDSRLTVAMELPDGPFVLRYEAPSRPALPPGPPPAPGLRWRVETARSPGVARWGGARGRSLRGEGYADRVDLDGLPRASGLEEIVWGRAHGPGGTTVFTAIRSAAGGDWRRAAVWSDGATAEDWPEWRTGFRIHRAGVRWEVTLAGDDAPRLRAGGGRVLHDGDCLDPARAPGRLERVLLRAAVGPGRQVRRLDPLLAGGPVRPGPCRSPLGGLVHERVRFGRRRTTGPGPSADRRSSPTVGGLSELTPPMYL